MRSGCSMDRRVLYDEQGEQLQKPEQGGDGLDQIGWVVNVV